MSSDRTILERHIGPLTRTDIVRYAGAGGDFNPLHHDELFAAAAGYPSTIAHGLFTAGLAGAALAEAVGPLHMRRYGVRYTGPVLPGDTLMILATERCEEPEGELRHIDVEVTATAEGAEARSVLLATAEVTR